MYYVLGADGGQYGPIDEATLRAWIAEGRVGPPTMSFKAGEAEWVAMSTRGDFAGAFPSVSPPTAPGIPPVRMPSAVVPVVPSGQKEWIVALILSVLLGYFGVDRFYLGHIALGVLKLVTFGGCGIWWLIDVVLIAVGAVRDDRGRPLVKTI